MKILIVWDAPEEAALLELYLGAGDNTAAYVSTPEEAMTRAGAESWNAVLLAMTMPTPEAGFLLYGRLQQQMPAVPIVLACRPNEMLQLPRFLLNGLRFYLFRDTGGDFVFLVLSCLEMALAAVRAEESRKLAERLREEMDGIRTLQESIIPRGLTPPKGYKISARYEPSEVRVVGDRPVVMAGGDYYDLFRPDERTLILLVGDASGHGLKACMSIMTMHTLVRMMSGDRFRDTAGFVSEINQRLCENSIVQSGGGFITMLYAAIDTVNHTMTWTSAGHPNAILHCCSDKSVVEIRNEADEGMPLGIMAETNYTSGTVEIPPGSQLLLYTDGLTDAFPIDQKGKFQPFGVQGIMNALKATTLGDPEQSLQQLFDASHSYTGGSGRHDDTSAVLLQRDA
jgi:serine phosphatase RsbU (regulator of sigma subunit)/CheY-like chemotaxis protein